MHCFTFKFGLGAYCGRCVQVKDSQVCYHDGEQLTRVREDRGPIKVVVLHRIVNNQIYMLNNKQCICYFGVLNYLVEK